MSGTSLRTLIVVVFLIHGVGQFMGIIPALRLFGTESGGGPEWFRNWTSDSWLLTDLVGSAATRIVCLLLFGAAFIGFVTAGLGLAGGLVPYGWWRPLAVASAAIALVALILFWDALIYFFPHKVGDIAVNLAVLVCLLGLSWPSDAALGV